MSPRHISPVKTLSPRRSLGQDHGNQMSPLHKQLVRLARGELAPRLSLVSPKVFFFILSLGAFTWSIAIGLKVQSELNAPYKHLNWNKNAQTE